MSNYYQLVRCNNCHRIHPWAPFGAGFENLHHHDRFCKRCGEFAGYYDSVETWISTVKWWNPRTWGSGHWVKKE
ncbi:hypothetical protein KKJ25_12275 [Xenorhabdus bovienii]|uniref:hypothetical protein n=1 Tax=Xenorhabdus bovienii TaxID=40576 RepID=UPI00237CA067|nr:hypothetical protein [Xenorhabdus bovienii]MDE1495701.1 hypothetical protein [Xenorhabdus bovienii]MDE9475291.1 hypothetical protein [Xenorhabdus bovienii]